MSLARENRVIIYIWFNEADGGYNVGHAALEIPNENIYISLWPGKRSEKSPSFLSYFEHRDEIFFHTYEDDIASERRIEDFKCCLYSLDIEAIKNRKEELFPNIANWTIIGNTKLNRPNENISHSCSSLVFDLLIAGGVTDMVSFIGITTRLAPSPHNVFTLTRSAKINELDNHPETLEFDEADSFAFDPHNEVSTLAIAQEIKHNCTIS